MDKNIKGIAAIILALSVVLISLTYYRNSSINAENSKTNAARLKLEVFKEAGQREFYMKDFRTDRGIDYEFSPHPEDLEELILGAD